MLSIFRRRYLPRRPWSSSTSWPSVISPMLNVFTRSDRYSVGWLVQIMNGVSSIVVPSLLNICMILAPWWWMLWIRRTLGPLLPRSTSLLTHAEHSWALALSALKQEWIFCSKNCWRRIFLLLITEENSYSPLPEADHWVWPQLLPRPEHQELCHLGGQEALPAPGRAHDHGPPAFSDPGGPGLDTRWEILSKHFAILAILTHNSLFFRTVSTFNNRTWRLERGRRLMKLRSSMLPRSLPPLKPAMNI